MRVQAMESGIAQPPSLLHSSIPPASPQSPQMADHEPKPPATRYSISRKPLPKTPGAESSSPSSPLPPRTSSRQPPQLAGSNGRQHSGHSQSSSRPSRTPSFEMGAEEAFSKRQSAPMQETQIQNLPVRQRDIRHVSDGIPQSEVGEISVVGGPEMDGMHNNGTYDYGEPQEMFQPLQYHHQPKRASRVTADSSSSHSHSASLGTQGVKGSGQDLLMPRSELPRPNSTLTLGSDGGFRGRTGSPRLSFGRSASPLGSPNAYARGLSSNRRTPDGRPVSYIDLLNTPYAQQVAPAPSMNNAFLRNAVGTDAALLDTRKTLQLYRANVKKTNDPAIQYEFAIFMIQAARDAETKEEGDELVREARQILQKLGDRGYPFAQYYLGDGYSSGLFNKGKQDWERAFPLFVAASKHGHAEAGYRAALCYEFGWGCRKDYSKAVQFYRAAASKNHPGAAGRLGRACMTGDMGLGIRAREGSRWLKRAAESADHQYNSAPYELGVLHEHGHGDDIFKDEAYAAQLFTKSADLGHPEAALRMGQAYEHGLLSCPKDPALSVHFYNCAAQAGLPEAMMALCAWYFVGAEPVLEKDENEAYEWAKKAAEAGYIKAQYAVGYFTEMGVGCRRDPLEANVWYVRAADQGDDKAKQRLQIIQDAAAGGVRGKPQAPTTPTEDKKKKKLLSKFR